MCQAISEYTKKHESNMKTLFRTLLFITIMIMGTASANAIVNINTDFLPDDQSMEDMKVSLKKKKCHLCHIHTEMCGGKYVKDRTRVYPGMNKRLRHHIMRGHHKWHRDVCRKCNLTKKEVRTMEVQIRKMESELQRSASQRTQERAEKRRLRDERQKLHRQEKQQAKVERHNIRQEKIKARKERRLARRKAR